MRKILPVLLVLMLTLTACGNFPLSGNNDQVSDAEMATRVAELLSTMTTPTAEIVFPPTPTPTSAAPEPTKTPEQETPVVVTEEPGENATEPAVAETPSEESPTPDTTTTASPTSTLEVPDTDPILKLGKPSTSDSFDSYENWSWPTGSDSYLTVSFKDGYMEMTGLTSMAGWRLPMVAQQTNSYIELTVNSAACADKDSYGIIFRVPVFKEPTQGYLYEVTCDGYLRLWKWNGNIKPKGEAEILINWKESPDIHKGANQVNRLGVMVVGKKFTLYMNGVPQGEASDSSFSAGFFGTFVRSVSTPKYTVKFDEMKIWENPAQ
ncbi:MAG TPA: hypothetical protein PLV27_06220 [Anaerolineaceae bacterium]|nr:hypothetical protein [Anaerolineaceae bacterium]